MLGFKGSRSRPFLSLFKSVRSVQSVDTSPLPVSFKVKKWWGEAPSEPGGARQLDIGKPAAHARDPIFVTKGDTVDGYVQNFHLEHAAGTIDI